MPACQRLWCCTARCPSPWSGTRGNRRSRAAGPWHDADPGRLRCAGRRCSVQHLAGHTACSRDGVPGARSSGDRRRPRERQGPVQHPDRLRRFGDRRHRHGGSSPAGCPRSTAWWAAPSLSTRPSAGGAQCPGRCLAVVGNAGCGGFIKRRCTGYDRHIWHGPTCADRVCPVATGSKPSIPGTCSFKIVNLSFISCLTAGGKLNI